MPLRYRWNWASIIGWIIVGLIIIDLLYWTGLGIYIAVDEPSNLEPILFNGSHIAVLIYMVYVIGLYFSDDSWWDFGVPHWMHMMLVWLVFTFLIIYEVFALLSDSIDPEFDNGVNGDLLISLGAIQLAFAFFGWLWAIIIGAIILWYHGGNGKAFMPSHHYGYQSQTHNPRMMTTTTVRTSPHPTAMSTVHTSRPSPFSASASHLAVTHSGVHPQQSMSQGAGQISTGSQMLSSYASSPLPTYTQPKLRLRNPNGMVTPNNAQHALNMGGAW